MKRWKWMQKEAIMLKIFIMATFATVAMIRNRLKGFGMCVRPARTMIFVKSVTTRGGICTIWSKSPNLQVIAKKCNVCSISNVENRCAAQQKWGKWTFGWVRWSTSYVILWDEFWCNIDLLCIIFQPWWRSRLDHSLKYGTCNNQISKIYVGEATSDEFRVASTPHLNLFPQDEDNL